VRPRGAGETCVESLTLCENLTGDCHPDRDNDDRVCDVHELGSNLPPPKPQRHRSKENRRQPHPYQLARQHAHTSLAEECADADRRDLNRREREEVSRVVERREERHSESAVREGIEDAMRRGGEEEIQQQLAARDGSCSRRECDGDHHCAQNRRKEE